MRYLLDANAFILLLAGHPKLVGRAGECDEGDLTISAIAFAEVAIGSWAGKRPSLLLLDQITTRIPILPFDHLSAKTYAQLPFKRGNFDRLIAAHALSLNLTLVTTNERDFNDLPHLRVENWTL